MTSQSLPGVLDLLSTAHDVERVALVLRRVARSLVGAEGITFVLRDGAFCHYVEEDAIAPLWKGQRFPVNECISGWVMSHDVPVLIADIYADTRVPHEAYRTTFVRSMAMVPIGRPSIGAIGAYWARPREVSPSEVEMLQAMADSVALALQP